VHELSTSYTSFLLGSIVLLRSLEQKVQHMFPKICATCMRVAIALTSFNIICIKCRIVQFKLIFILCRQDHSNLIKSLEIGGSFISLDMNLASKLTSPELVFTKLILQILYWIYEIAIHMRLCIGFAH
jgi:hypothetical protein